MDAAGRCLDAESADPEDDEQCADEPEHVPPPSGEDGVLAAHAPARSPAPPPCEGSRGGSGVDPDPDPGLSRRVVMPIKRMLNLAQERSRKGGGVGIGE